MKSENIEILKEDGVGIIPTDTVYGLVGSALSARAVEKISNLKRRSDGKAFIVLISSPDDLKIFGIKLSSNIKNFLDKVWPGKVSVEFFSDLPKFKYLRNSDNTNAFRLPNKPDLLALLKQTGPLIAPSANPEGLSPAKNITEAENYFGESVDFYEDGGVLESEPSTLVKIISDKIEVIRQGAVKIVEN